MSKQWSNSNAVQLELLEAEPGTLSDAQVPEDHRPARQVSAAPAPRPWARTARSNDGHPLVVAVAQLYEDPNNPRTEFPGSDIEELADDIRRHGILQAIVVPPADAAGRYRIHFGAKRIRAARRAGLEEVPVVVRDAPADTYAQVAENQKRHGLTPLDLARFIRAKVNEGESNATIAARLGMDPTTVGHHLALLELPPELDDALKSGRCTSPRTLYELSKLHEAQPGRAKALVTGECEITRAAIAAIRAEQTSATPGAHPQRNAASLLAQANSACARLELVLTRIKQVEHDLVQADLEALRQRLANLTHRSA